MLPVAPVAFPLTCPPVRPRGVGALCVDADEANTLTRLETELELQRAVIRKAMAEVVPLGQKTVRGGLNEMVNDVDEVSPEDDDDDEEEEEDREFEFET